LCMCGRGKLSAIFIKGCSGVGCLCCVNSKAGCMCKVKFIFLEPLPNLCSFLPQFIVGTFRNVNAVVFVIGL
jgi:hypothetical protein